ncbi:hypothetical protein EUX98_g9805, partial [Antrodiella citrinella]
MAKDGTISTLTSERDELLRKEAHAQEAKRSAEEQAKGLNEQLTTAATEHSTQLMAKDGTISTLTSERDELLRKEAHAQEAKRSAEEQAKGLNEQLT